VSGSWVRFPRIRVQIIFAPVKALRRQLLRFYERDARELPWRTTQDPYRIWISEIMLQQTQVLTVIERYQRFLRRFPDVEALASASVDEVCEEWAGLGYYSRARNLHTAARRLSDEHAGRLPTEPSSLLALPGIGPYTAGAIASIAYGQPVAAVDGNAERVLSRLFAVSGAPSASRRKRLWELAGELADSPHSGHVNQALMDVAAAFCRPKNPLCEECPISRHCEATRLGSPESYPARKPRTARKRLDVAMLWNQRSENSAVLLEQRHPSGLWAGQWQLPSEEGEAAREKLGARLDCETEDTGVQVRHLLTHREVVARVYRSEKFFDQPVERMRWESAPRSAPVNALSRKVIDLMLR
jgi:A/G-specific adenine glycosylase